MDERIDYEKDLWVYDSAIDAPRLATPKDMQDLRTCMGYFGCLYGICGDLWTTIGRLSMDRKFQFVKEIDAAIAPVLKNYSIDPHA